MFSPAGLSQNTVAILFVVAFILLGGLLLVKMPGRKYEKGAVKRSLSGLRRVFPGLFSISALDRPENDEIPKEAPTESAGEARQLAFETILEEAGVAPDARENNPMIVGIFISATVTVVLFGIGILISLGYFGG